MATVGLVADSAFLITAATPAGLVMPMQRLHLLLGGVLCATLPAFVALHWYLHKQHRNVGARRIGMVLAALAIAGCIAGAGLWLAGKSSATRWVVQLHEAAFVASLLAYLLHRLRAKVTPALGGERLAAVFALLLTAGIWGAQTLWPPTQEPSETQRAAFEPGLSEARLADGHVLSPAALADPDYCAQCHGSIAERWESSAHHFSSLNDPFYAATLKLGQEHRTPDQLKFCGGCHDPLLLFTGRMDTHPQPNDPDADQGITCLVCHAIDRAPGRQGNGSYVIAEVDHYPGFDSDDPDERERSRRLIRSRPEQHIASFAKPHLRTPEMCVPCHKAHIPGALNDHRRLGGQNEFDPWHDSGAGGYSARTFFPPGPQKRCQDCHMPRVPSDDPAAIEGTVADHAFLGSNTALPRALGDEAWVARNQAFMAGAVSVDITAVEVESGGDTLRLLAPGGSMAAPPQASVVLDIVVRNEASGHLFPGGIVDLRESWLEVTLRGEDGTVIEGSGWLTPKGELDPDAHLWNAVLVDRNGRTLTQHDVEAAHAVLSSRRIMLGASDVIRVAFAAPTQASTVEVRVLDRKLSRGYVEFVLGPDAAAMPVTVLAATTLSVAATAPVATEPPQDKDTGRRLRNLGIGHLLRGDTALAKQAAAAAAERLPGDPGPWLDQARAALDDGALDLAERHVRHADGLSPGHPTGAWLLARVRAARGEHAAALTALEVALQAFPQDRALLVMRGRSQYRLEQADEAIATLRSVLEIDPENLSAHALLAKIFEEQGDAPLAAEHRARWDELRPHSEDQVVTERVRREYPALDRRANRQYVLPLAPVPSGWRLAAPKTAR